MMTIVRRIIVAAMLLPLCLGASAQKYNKIIDKSVAVVGNELITISDIEACSPSCS